MSFRVTLLPRAEADVDGILSYLSQRSPQGAESWFHRMQEVLADLRLKPLSHGLAPESAQHGAEIRHVMFKTRRGRMYRVLFMVVDQTVYVLHVRGPGQDLVPSNEMRLP